LTRPQAKPDDAGLHEEIARPSLALFDRREQEYVSLDRLPRPEMYEGTRLVKISPDRRQTLCYQCHAPEATAQVGSGDDRTPIGVHEGLSCLACHEKHGQTTRASGSTCHPQLSNCGINVEAMDTTFKSVKSPHNVHTVKCSDCHTKGVPQKKGKNHEGHEVARRTSD
jgi:RNase P subunit RPR2